MRSRKVVGPAAGGGTLGSRQVNAARLSQTSAPAYPAAGEASKSMALMSQHPHIHPKVAVARIGPNWRWECRNREKMIVLAMLVVGVATIAQTWITASTAHGRRP